MQLENLLGSKTKIKVLSKLSTRLDWQFSISELARDLKLDKSLISRTISELEKLNVVKVLRKGPVKLVSMNKENEFVKSIISVFNEPIAVVNKICEEFIKKLVPRENEIASVLLYGSTAKGTFTPASDVDIMIITKKRTELKQKLDSIASEFSKRDIIIFYDLLTKAELGKLIKQKEPAIIDMIKNHRVMWGEQV